MIWTRSKTVRILSQSRKIVKCEFFDGAVSPEKRLLSRQRNGRQVGVFYPFFRTSESAPPHGIFLCLSGAFVVKFFFRSMQCGE